MRLALTAVLLAVVLVAGCGRSGAPQFELTDVTGMGVPGTFPALSGSKMLTGQKQAQINVVLNGVVKDGKPTAMVSFKHLSDVDIAAVITYTRNNWANQTGDAVASADVNALRK